MILTGLPLGSVTHLNAECVMKLVTFHHLPMFRVSKSFTYDVITERVVPESFDACCTIAVAEVDYDSDRLMDLYVAETTSVHLHCLWPQTTPDLILRNFSGRQLDAIHSEEIKDHGDSRGVTTRDFNNDSCIDLVILRYHRPKYQLINNGDRTVRTPASCFFLLGGFVLLPCCVRFFWLSDRSLWAWSDIRWSFYV